MSIKRLFDAVERRGDIGRRIAALVLPISNRPRVTSSCAGKIGLRKPGEHTSGPNLASRDNVAHSQNLYTILWSGPAASIGWNASRPGVSERPLGGGRAKIENSSRRHPRKFAVKRFLVVRGRLLVRKWGGLFWATSLEKIFGGVIAISYPFGREHGRHRAVKRRAFLTLLGGAAVVLPAAVGGAESFPTRPIRLIVPYPAGGGTDIVGRVLG